jgi:GNAT superfamily N-acetyltransferase
MIRSATRHDAAAIASVATAYGFDEPDSGIDPRYLELLLEHGRLAVAEVDGAVVGFGGSIESCGAAMVTDLFVLEKHLGQGLGGGLLRHLIGDCEHRMTCSSKHPRAIPTYGRFGMVPRWRVRYLTGSVVHQPHDTTVTRVDLAHWRGPRRELASYWALRGADLLHLGDPARPSGSAVVADRSGQWMILRLDSDGAHDEAVASVMSRLPKGEPLLTFVPEWSAASAFLDGQHFDEIDHDVFCASAGVVIPSATVVMHPGLA